MRELAARAGSDPAALRELRGITSVDGRAVDLRTALEGARGEELRARLRLLTDPVDDAAASEAGADRLEAERLLAGDRFQADDGPGWARSLRDAIAGTLGDARDALARRLPGGGATIWTLLAFAVAALAAWQAHRPPRRGRSGAGWRPPFESLVPSILWFFLKFGLFLVGALVFWKRPADRSAASSSCSVCHAGGLHGRLPLVADRHPAGAAAGVHGLRRAAAGRVSLHFYLVFPRPQGFLERRRADAARASTARRWLSWLLCWSLHYAAGPLAGGQPGAAADVARGRCGRLLHGHLRLLRRGRAVVPRQRRQPGPQLPAGRRRHRAQPGQVDPVRRAGRRWCRSATRLPGALEPDDFGGGAATWPMFAASVCFTRRSPSASPATG